MAWRGVGIRGTLWKHGDGFLHATFTMVGFVTVKVVCFVGCERVIHMVIAVTSSPIHDSVAIKALVGAIIILYQHYIVFCIYPFEIDHIVFIHYLMKVYGR